MQAYVEIMLVAILVVVLFQPPLALSNLAKSVLGKALFIVLVVFLAHQFGTNAGLLAAMITIGLLNHTREGFLEEIIERMKPLGSSHVGNSACDSNPDSPECTKALSTIGKNNAAQGGVKSDRPDDDDANGLTHEKVVVQERTGKGKQHPISSYKPQSRGGNNNSEVNEQQQQQPTPTPTPKPTPKPTPPKEAPKEAPKEDPEEDPEEAPKEAPKKEKFSNYTLDNAAAFPSLGSTLAAYSTNDNIMRSMRASEYAKTAPGGSTLLTNHQQTTILVNNNDPSLAGIL